jgi:diguanylate cyclase (GGDEF)-like protein/PAS domain S-box-containing protein
MMGFFPAKDGAGVTADTAGLRADLQRALTLLATAHDEVAAANLELGRRQSFTEALLETVEVGIVSCDADGHYLMRNRAQRAMFGIEAGSPPLQPDDAAPLSDVLDSEGRRLTVEQYPLMRALRGEELGPVDLQLGPPGGPHLEVVARGGKIVGPDGAVLGAVVSITDVTAERAASRELTEERRRLTEAQRVGQVGSFEHDFVNGTWTFSDQLPVLWGVDPDEVDATTLVGLIVEEDREEALQSWPTNLRLGGQHTHDFRIRRENDGAERVLRSRIELQLGPDGRPAHARGTNVDITDVTSAQREAQRASAFFDAVLSASPDFTFVTDVATGAVVYGSRDMDILGMRSEQLQALGSHARLALVHPDDQPRLLTADTDACQVDDGQVLQLRYRAMHAEGRWHWLNRRATPFRRDKSGAVVEVLAVLRDVTDAVEAEDQLAHTALHDDLTGLSNRLLLIDRLKSALARSARDGQEIAVLFCDLDAFKRVNDASGHAAGDAVLLEIAQRLKSVARDGDTVARVGGDEFVIVVEPWNTDRGEHSGRDGFMALPDRFAAVRVAELVVSAVSQPITINGVTHVVTVSVGVAYARHPSGEHADPVTPEEVLQDADAAMYRAKSRGKDRFALFEHVLRRDLAERGRVERVLRTALDLPRATPAPGSPTRVPTLSAAYQPIFDRGLGTLVGFEALARLTDAAGLNIPPDVFIAVAEETGIIHPLGTLMLELACGQLQAWRAAFAGLEHVSMAVNVSALQAQDATLGDAVRRVLSSHDLAPGDLVLELTETALLQAAQSTITTLRALHTAGVGIAIDDFGTGYASLRYLATLPITAIKIDRTFTAGLPHDETSRKIVKAVAGLAADLDLECIVEGVETAEQRAALPEGVQLQGWLTGRPAAPEALDLPHLVGVGAPGTPDGP